MISKLSSIKNSYFVQVYLNFFWGVRLENHALFSSQDYKLVPARTAGKNYELFGELLVNTINTKCRIL